MPHAIAARTTRSPPGTTSGREYPPGEGSGRPNARWPSSRIIWSKRISRRPAFCPEDRRRKGIAVHARPQEDPRSRHHRGQDERDHGGHQLSTISRGGRGARATSAPQATSPSSLVTSAPQAPASAIAVAGRPSRCGAIPMPPSMKNPARGRSMRPEVAWRSTTGMAPRIKMRRERARDVAARAQRVEDREEGHREEEEGHEARQPRVEWPTLVATAAVRIPTPRGYSGCAWSVPSSRGGASSRARAALGAQMRMASFSAIPNVRIRVVEREHRDDGQRGAAASSRTARASDRGRPGGRRARGGAGTSRSARSPRRGLAAAERGHDDPAPQPRPSRRGPGPRGLRARRASRCRRARSRLLAGRSRAREEKARAAAPARRRKTAVPGSSAITWAPRRRPPTGSRPGS